MANFSKDFTKHFAIAAAMAMVAGGAGAKDNVIMTVGGIDVPTSEFEYLYHKNNQQQLSPQSLNDYVEMFKLYRMKVAEALAERLDTMESFRKEMAQYRSELAQPYLTDSTYIYQLVDEAVQRASTEVSPSHIMISKTRDAKKNVQRRHTADSILNVLKNGGNFQELVKRHSMDRQIADSTGSLGFFAANMLPYAFEVAAFNLPEGEISEVVESPAGYHIIKGGPHRPWTGKVLASHIMKLVKPGASAEEEARAKHEIDSLYAVVKANPSAFSDVAKANSDDVGSARDGGRLPWFGTHEMVPEFEKTAFALGIGEISEPVRSQYGWHIILKSDAKNEPDRNEIKKIVLARIKNSGDPRHDMVRNHQIDVLAKKHNASINQTTKQMLENAVSHQGLDSLFWESLKVPGGYTNPLATIDGKNISVADFGEYALEMGWPVGDDEVASLDNIMTSFYRKSLIEAEEDWLYDNVADYHNLMKEYHDGSLLYEVSSRNVWNKASNDKEGLKKYFEENRDSYSWNEPKVKGYLIQAANDSVAALIKQRLAQLPQDSIMIGVRKEFKSNARIDAVLLSQGANPMVDHLMFNGPEVKPNSDKFTTYFLFGERLITKPEDVNDVRGQVTSDYQNYLEKLWEESLRKKYQVKVNSKELKKVK